MINIKQQEQLFIEIGKRLKKKIEVYAIGGTAMMFLGLKEETLDVDLVFKNSEDRKAFEDAARILGYEDMDSSIVYGKKDDGPEMLIFGETRLDLFLLRVVTSVFSGGMKERAVQMYEFGENLILRAADFHDIIIMKSATSRAKDEDDILRIIKTKEINWDILIKEVEEQIKIGRETAVLNLGTLLEKLRDRHKIMIPQDALDRLWNILERQVKEKKSRGGKSVHNEKAKKKHL